MEGYYKRAHEHCECGRFTYRASEALPGGAQPLIPGFQSKDVTQDLIWRFSLPTDFGKRDSAALKTSRRVSVYLHANCLGLLSTKEGGRVTGLRVASLQRNEFVVRAKYYVISAGCLDTARLLLVSTDSSPNGLGNQRDLVGRFYGGHMTGDLCTATFTPKGGPVIWNYERTLEGVYSRRALTIEEETVRREGLLNMRVTLSHPPIPDVSHRNGILSAAYLVKRFLVDKIPPEFSKALAETKYRDIRGHLKNVLLDAPNLAGFSVHWLRWRILARRKMPSIAFPSPEQLYCLHFDAEQAPNPENRVRLGEEKDALGMPRLRVDWHYSDRDVESALRCFQIIKRDFERCGVGKMNSTDAEVVENIRRGACAGAHQFGTTRMAADPSRGVVDSNCRVHGIDNLFISTSSVFPTVSYVNPVLTIVALGIRLADHLKVLSERKPTVTGGPGRSPGAERLQAV
jgi:choline dehydrogenase-like flavoprotein